MSRRTTLGGLSSSAVNSRASRASLGPGRVTNDIPAKSRASISVAPAATGRKSSGAPLPASRRSSTGVGMQPRKSSAQPRSTVGRTDPRNITDKRYVPTNIRVLIDYLTAHGFDHTISPKILTSPTAKDFNNIVQFLFRQVDSNLSCPGKFEDEVISMFKYLRYPYPISKNGLSAVGSPHSWPQLLASVMWLIELLEYDTSAQNETQDDEEDEGASEKAFFSYLRSAYIAFLSGDDPYYQQLEEEFIDSFENKNIDINAQREALERENAALQSEIEEVENRRQYLPQLQEKKRDYEADRGKFETLIDQLHKHKESLESKVASRKAELDKLLSNSALVQEDITSLRAKIASQELSPEDVRRMSEEKDHLQESLRAASDNNSIMAKRVWETETQLREKVTALEDLNREYTMLAEDLELLPATARNAQGRDIALHIDIRAKKRSDLLQSDVKAVIQPFLQQLKLEVNASTAELQGDAMAIADDIEEVEVHAAKLREEQTVIESKLRRVEEAYRREKEALESMVAAHDSEMDQLEAKLLRLRDVSGEELALSTATRKLKDLRKQRVANKEHYKASKQALIDEIMGVVTECANYREHTQQRLTEVRELFNLKLHSLLLDNGGHPFRGSSSQLATITTRRNISTSSEIDHGDMLSLSADNVSMEISAGHDQLRASELKSNSFHSGSNDMLAFNNEDGVSVSPIAAPYSSRSAGRRVQDDSYVAQGEYSGSNTSDDIKNLSRLLPCSSAEEAVTTRRIVTNLKDRIDLAAEEDQDFDYVCGEVRHKFRAGNNTQYIVETLKTKYRVSP